MFSIAKCIATGLLCAFAASASLLAADGVVEVKLGAGVKRTWDQVKADNYAYGPKQDFDPSAGETHVYLPYGNDPKLYAEVNGSISDAGKDAGLSKFHSVDGSTNALLTFKLHFDKPISSFRYCDSWTEMGLAENTVGGVEYSADGKDWKTLREIKGSDKVAMPLNELVSPKNKISGLNTDTLYIRYYTRDPKDPTGSGAGRWLQFWLCGDPNWGDAATTFFARQCQVWVTPAK